MPPNACSKISWRPIMDKLQIVKIGGSILNQDDSLSSFIQDFSQIKEPKILVHGGGAQASKLSEQLGIEVIMKDGRRITNEDSLKVAVMVYAGLINKTLVAKLQATNCNAIGLSGADLNVIPAQKRNHPKINYGWVGDIEPGAINGLFIRRLLAEGAVPVFCAITHDNQGHLLNTNADTIARRLAETHSEHFETKLTYCMDIDGVRKDVAKPASLISNISLSQFQKMRKAGSITDGMIPKLKNGFEALQNGTSSVSIRHADNLLNQTGTYLNHE